MPMRECDPSGVHGRDWLFKAEAALVGAGIENARQEARWMLEELCGLKMPYGQLTKAQEHALDGALLRRQRREPLQYVLGSQPFLDFSLKVDGRVLIPRPDTELLYHKAVQLAVRFQAPRVLDLCTGSGALAIALSRAFPHARVTAADISGGALEIARENARQNGAEIEFCQGDLFGAVKGRRFDIIVSNPPYLSGEDMARLQPELAYEPALALFGGQDGYEVFRRIAMDAPAHLAEGGFLLLEAGAGQAQAIKEMLISAFPEGKVHLFQDGAGIARVAALDNQYFGGDGHAGTV